ncbi:MAG: hypothetical protein FWD79_11530 [Desulfobulbus sp.]|nr:hypothetical protein [Desulfobulbus sp.]
MNLQPYCSHWGAARIAYRLACSGLLLCPALLPAQSLAGQTIVIDSSSGTGGMVTHDVYGNGTPPDGMILGAITPSVMGNTITVNSGGSVNRLGGGSVFGGIAGMMTCGSVLATASGNSVSTAAERWIP